MGYKSLEELREENRHLKVKRELEEEMRAYDEEVKKAKRENFALKHGKKVRFVKRMGRGFAVMGSELAHGLKGMAENYHRANKPKKTRRVKRVRRIKKKKKISLPYGF